MGMNMKVIKLEDIKALLREYADLKDTDESIPSIKAGHGPCCTCQTCGYGHDECVCIHNELIQKLADLAIII